MSVKSKDQLGRICTRVTRTCFLRLRDECKRRELQEAARIPYGKIISELTLLYVPPYDGEETVVRESLPVVKRKASGRAKVNTLRATG